MEYTYKGAIADALSYRDKVFYLIPGSSINLDAGMDNEPYFKRLILSGDLVKNENTIKVEVVESAGSQTVKNLSDQNKEE